MKYSYVYIVANGYNGTSYIGVTSDLVKRVWQHKQAEADGFTKRYSIKQLMWYEIHDSIEAAIQREKQLKKWNRLWKLRLINEANPNWKTYTILLFSEDTKDWIPAYAGMTWS